MQKTLNALFFLTLISVGVAFAFSGVSLTVSLVALLPLSIALFTSAAFLFFLVAVICEKSPKPQASKKKVPSQWTSEEVLQV